MIPVLEYDVGGDCSQMLEEPVCGAPGDDSLAPCQDREACEQQCFGVPTLSFDGSPAIFGPVVDRRITGEEAGELWDHVAWLIRRGFFFELKRNRTTRADVGRYRVQTAA